MKARWPDGMMARWQDGETGRRRDGEMTSIQYVPTFRGASSAEDYSRSAWANSAALGRTGLDWTGRRRGIQTWDSNTSTTTCRTACSPAMTESCMVVV